MNDKEIDFVERKERRPAENEKIRTDSKNAVPAVPASRQKPKMRGKEGWT